MSTETLLLAWYGDDFTGSTDVMEALTRSGVSSALFLDPPRTEDLAAFPGLRAFGVAGVSRSLSPEGMEAELTPVFTALKKTGAPLVHYKICSTFDSSPTIGSIGKAIDIGQEIFGSTFIPLVVGAPYLGRYVVFGNLWARSGLESEPFRLDRHPTMNRHPVTPMDESDLRLHLAKQTNSRIGLFDALKIAQPLPNARAGLSSLLAAVEAPEILLFDTLYDSHLETIGALLAEHADSDTPLFVVGSSGVEYALTAHWRTQGDLPDAPLLRRSPVERLLAVSGSASPVTARQIEAALANGFAEIPLDTAALVTPETVEREITRAITEGMRILATTGKSPLLHACRGPEDPRLLETRERLATLGSKSEDSGPLLGTALGRILRGLWKGTDLQRAVVTGGDTSGYVARALGVRALTMLAPHAPGSPLCRIHAPDSPADGREITFKGGQVGTVDFFRQALSE